VFRLLSPVLVDLIHDEVQNPGELAGRARDKSLDSVLGRVNNRLAYGMIDDASSLAAHYAAAIAQGHCFNEANKRTAFRSLYAVLDLNGIGVTLETKATSDRIIQLAQGKLSPDDLAAWLKEQVNGAT